MDLRGNLLGLIGTLRSLDSETVTLLTRLVMRAVKSGDANGYIKRHLQALLDEEDRAELGSRAKPSVTTRPAR